MLIIVLVFLLTVLPNVGMENNNCEKLNLLKYYDDGSISKKSLVQYALSAHAIKPSVSLNWHTLENIPYDIQTELIDYELNKKWNITAALKQKNEQAYKNYVAFYTANALEPTAMTSVLSYLKNIYQKNDNTFASIIDPDQKLYSTPAIMPFVELVGALCTSINEDIEKSFFKIFVQAVFSKEIYTLISNKKVFESSSIKKVLKIDDDMIYLSRKKGTSYIKYKDHIKELPYSKHIMEKTKDYLVVSLYDFERCRAGFFIWKLSDLTADPREYIYDICTASIEHIAVQENYVLAATSKNVRIFNITDDAVEKIKEERIRCYSVTPFGDNFIISFSKGMVKKSYFITEYVINGSSHRWPVKLPYYMIQDLSDNTFLAYSNNDISIGIKTEIQSEYGIGNYLKIIPNFIKAIYPIENMAISFLCMASSSNHKLMLHSIKDKSWSIIPTSSKIKTIYADPEDMVIITGHNDGSVRYWDINEKIQHIRLAELLLLLSPEKKETKKTDSWLNEIKKAMNFTALI